MSKTNVMTKGILTVGELKEILAKHSEDTQIVVADSSWYLNINEVMEVNEDEGMFAITLFTNNDFDPRQF